LAFMCIPKNANTSIKRALLKAIYNIDEIANPHDPKYFIYTNKEWIHAQKAWLIIAVKRDPLDRLISCWREKVMNTQKLHSGFRKHKDIRWKQSWSKFVEVIKNIPDYFSDQHFRSQSWDLYVRHEVVPNMMIAFENLADGWHLVQKRVLEHCELKLPLLDKVNETPTNIAWPEINEYDRNLVHSRYRLDYRLLGY